MPRYRLTIEYDGTAFHGLQRQAEGLLTVQQVIEDAVKSFSLEATTLHAAGRTDTGVHATGQVVHFDVSKFFPVETVLTAINHFTQPHPVAVVEVQEVSEEFHARFSAKGRHYHYRILNRPARLALEEKRAWHIAQPLDIEAMRQAAAMLIGTHDFTSFRSTQCQSKSPVKTLDRLDIEQNGEEISLYVSARSFMHNQVRITVGTLAQVGLGRWTLEEFRNAFEACDRTRAGPTAPAHGLYLIGVDY